MNQAAPKLLIMIPVYKNADHLEELSIRAKKTKVKSVEYDTKILVIDDSSADNSGEIIQNQNFESELLLQAGLYNINIDEVPISTIYNAGNFSISCAGDKLRFYPADLGEDNVMIKFDKDERRKI